MKESPVWPLEAGTFQNRSPKAYLTTRVVGGPCTGAHTGAMPHTERSSTELHRDQLAAYSGPGPRPAPDDAGKGGARGVRGRPGIAKGRWARYRNGAMMEVDVSGGGRAVTGDAKTTFHG